MASTSRPAQETSPAEAQYQSLYRRYRPQRFSEVRGQDLAATTLRNAVRDGRIVHAYLFSGPRGTGKTTTARILAKALNCLDPSDGEPCGVCSSCETISRGASLDVHELDAASNNGVEAMRDLVARASLATPGKRKVYIIDEVHMLSTAASNALLKTLEEPPEHVVFVLATTDPQKVLPTIRSRTQHFEFHLLEQAVLETLLSDVATDAGLTLPPDGIESAVRRGHGSARDALSALDQVAASGIVEDDGRFIARLLSAIVERDSPEALRAVAEAVAAGFESQRLSVELVEALRQQFLASVARHSVRPDDELLDSEGRPLLSPARSVRALEVLGKAIVDMRESIDPRITLEVAMVRLTSPEADDSTAAVLDRLERLERRLQELGQAPTARPAAPRPNAPPSGPPGERRALGAYRQAVPPPPPPTSEAPPDKHEEEDNAPSAPSRSLSRDELVTAWADDIVKSLKPRTRATFQMGRWISVEGDTAVFALPNAAHVEYASTLRDDVAAAIESHFSVPVRLELVVDSSAGTAVAAVPAAGSVPEEESVPEIDEATPAPAGPGDSQSWAEDRLKEAFPGAEEVS